MYWTVELDGGPRRVNHAAVAVGDKIWTFGGYCSGETLEAHQPIDVHVLDTRTFRWRAVKSANEAQYLGGKRPMRIHPPEDMDFSSDSDDDQVGMFPFNDIDRIGDGHGHNMDGLRDQEREGRLRERERQRQLQRMNSAQHSGVPYQRYGHTVCAYKGKVYLWGGRNDEYGASSSMHKFDPVRCFWSIVPATGRIPPARDGHSAVVVADKMYLFGGFEEELQRFSQETYVFDFETNTWSELRTFGAPPSWRDFHTAVAIDNNMYVFGGRSDQMGQFHSTRDLYDHKLKVLDVTTGQWTEATVTGEAPSGRRSHSAWVYNGKMYIFGGYEGRIHRHYNDMYSFDPKTSRWAKLKIMGKGPSPRRRQCTVVVGRRLFLFGGTMPVNNSIGGVQTGLADLADLYVMDYAPSLRTLASRRVVDLGLHHKYLYALPRDISNDLFNMIHPNTITNPPPQRLDVAG